MKNNFFLVMIVLGLFSCQKDGSHTDESPAEVDVYVAGYEYNGSNGTVAVAKYWKNGEARPITRGGFNSFATSIAVANNYVYIAETSLGAAVWKGNIYNGNVENGETGFFGGSSQQSGANPITVVGSSEYVAGFENGLAKYWKNGNHVILGDVSKYSEAHSIFLAKK